MLTTIDQSLHLECKRVVIMAVIEIVVLVLIAVVVVVIILEVVFGADNV